ncbi:uncharacterized protein AB675_3513 [Cyphellophora attinorum]|uniref:BTB domain-containing protein n=1 Tax=Cyphellophora attinorum TaxID=1664694 RepID=A0A0N0NLV1_9EURO|nr:uncharacterized protein AB675_3513 [Phialophora attinorum]KPI39608.1 hypothetical protein AB675_3513 [Phialophora attinorum]
MDAEVSSIPDDTAMAANTAALASLFYNSDFSDVTIKCQAREWKLHRVILASKCDFFRAACGGQFKVRYLKLKDLVSASDQLTATVQEAITGEIDLSDDDPEALDIVFRYIYTDSVVCIQKDLHDDFMPPGYLVTLLETARSADKYGLPGLALAAHDQLRQHFHRPIGPTVGSFVRIDVAKEIDQVLLLLHRLWEDEQNAKEAELRKFMLTELFAGLKGEDRKWFFRSSIKGHWQHSPADSKGCTDKQTRQIAVIDDLFNRHPQFAFTIMKIVFDETGEFLRYVDDRQAAVCKLEQTESVLNATIEELTDTNQDLRGEVADLKTKLGAAQQ